MNKDSLYTLIALIVIFALGSTIAVSEGSPQHWYGFISAFATVVLAATAIAGLNTWQKQVHYQSALATAKEAIPQAYKCKLLLKSIHSDFVNIEKADQRILERLSNNAQLCDDECNSLLSTLSALDESSFSEAEKLTSHFSAFKENSKGAVNFTPENEDSNLARFALFQAVQDSIKDLQKDESMIQLRLAKTQANSIYENLKNITLKR